MESLKLLLLDPVLGNAFATGEKIIVVLDKTSYVPMILTVCL